MTTDPDALTDGNPFAALAAITLRDTDTVPLLGAPTTAYDRWLWLMIVARERQLTDGQALDYAEALGFGLPQEEES